MSLKKSKRPSLLDKIEAKEALKAETEENSEEASKGGRVKATKRK